MGGGGGGGGGSDGVYDVAIGAGGGGGGYREIFGRLERLRLYPWVLGGGPFSRSLRSYKCHARSFFRGVFRGTTP